MDYQYQLQSPDGLMVGKRRKDSGTEDKGLQSPTNEISHGRFEYNSMGHKSFSDTNSLTIAQKSPTIQMGIRIMKEFGSIDAVFLDRTTIESFSDFIARERLSSMPHRGSLWDRVLRWAEFYALQIDDYAKKIGSFVPESQYAARQIYALLRTLLELGEPNAGALNTTFGIVRHVLRYCILL